MTKRARKIEVMKQLIIVQSCVNAFSTAGELMLSRLITLRYFSNAVLGMPEEDNPNKALLENILRKKINTLKITFAQT